ncbi:putative mitochondrial chaperone BCS1-B [Hypsibius exemplaris]|uniref:Mitochondrial chaperone BCS1 n=1 Tax=Hypsibius exemplaris TaxID=2072580 RepID=A0A1W0WCM7_HYPEX|nr:putative mitochondrial chaperone BCS1-B [Hypsibius exemplaris]
MLLAGTGLGQFIPADLNLSGGMGLAGLLAVIFPYIQRFILHMFDFNLTEYCAQFFLPDTFFGKLFEGNFALGTGVGIVGLGAALSFIQRTWAQLRAMYVERFSLSMKIGPQDNSYQDVVDWVNERQLKKARHISLNTGTKQTPSGKWESVYDYIPEIDTYKFKFKGRNYEISQESKSSDKDQLSVRGPPSLLLSSTGTNLGIFRDVLQEIKKDKKIRNEGMTTIYSACNGYWEAGRTKRKRPLESVILEDGVPEVIMSDVQDFIDSAEWYAEFGVPYRRGYLLYGPPGTGKTSFISAVAGHFDLNVCILNLSDKSLTDDSLNKLLIDAPEDTVILLEDVDSAFGSRDVTDDTDSRKKDGDASTSATAFEGMNRLTFSGLLNALDGVASAEGRILFMTTNHIDKLDSALIRPGRVDTKQFIGYASEGQVERMFRRFYRTASDDEAQRFVREVFDQPNRPEICLAQLQGLFLRYKKTPEAIFFGLSMLHSKD